MKYKHPGKTNSEDSHSLGGYNLKSCQKQPPEQTGFCNITEIAKHDVYAKLPILGPQQTLKV